MLYFCVLRSLAALGTQLCLLVERRISCKDASKSCLRLWTDIKLSLCIVLKNCDQPLKPYNGRRLRGDGQGQCMAGCRESLVTAATKAAELGSMQTGPQGDFDLDKYISLVDQQLVVVIK